MYSDLKIYENVITKYSNLPISDSSKIKFK